MNIVICNQEIEYQIVNEIHLFDARALIKLIWRNESYYLKKWLKSNPTALQDIDGVLHCTLDSLWTFWQDNVPATKSESKYYDEFSRYGWDKLDKLANPAPVIATVPKEDFDDMETMWKELNEDYCETVTAFDKLKVKYDKLVESSKKKTTLRDMLVNPELPLYAQLTTTIVLTFFTWTVFAHYFDFGSFSEYSLFHGGITLLAAVAFEFGLLIFTVRRDVMWLNISLFFQFLILGVHSGLLKFEYDSVEDFLVKVILTSLLPIINKAFSATNFKK